VLGRFFRKGLIALVIYGCVTGVFYWSPWLTGKIKPYLNAALTESIDFVKVKTVVADLFSYPSTTEPDSVSPSNVQD
jgi:hypothetical protein